MKKKKKKTMGITISGHVHNIVQMVNIQTTVELVHCQVQTPYLSTVWDSSPSPWLCGQTSHQYLDTGDCNLRGREMIIRYEQDSPPLLVVTGI